MTRLHALLRAVSSRRALVPAFVFSSLLLGLTFHEIVPQYHVEPLRQRGGTWRDHPTFLVGDCPYYRATLLSLLKDADLDIKNNFSRRQYAAAGNVAQGQHGEWYPKHTILMPIAALPFYVVAHDAGLVAFNAVQLSLLLTLMWLGARRYTSVTLATALTFWFAFGTMLRSAAYNFAPDIFSTLLVTAAVVAVLWRHAALAGVLLGFAVWSKWTNLVFLPLPGLFLLVHRDFRRVLRLAVACALPLLALMALNHHMFGSAFTTPYDRVLVMEGDHMVLEISHRAFFDVPFWTGLWRQLTDKQLGLWVACPPVLLAPLGAYWLAKRAPTEALLITAMCGAQLATFAKYEHWQASSYGPRFLLTVVSLSALLVAPVFDRLFLGRADYP
jgi:hypothetical protein